MLETKKRALTCLVILVVLKGEAAEAKCLVREPPDTLAPPQSTDAGFYLTVNGNPEYYEAGQLYTVTLRVRKNALSHRSITSPTERS